VSQGILAVALLCALACAVAAWRGYRRETRNAKARSAEMRAMLAMGLDDPTPYRPRSVLEDPDGCAFPTRGAVSVEERA